MPSRVGGKIRAIIKVVRRTQVLCATSAAVSIGSITTLFFLPISFDARIALLIPGFVLFSRKIFIIVYAREAIALLEFEDQFVSHGADHEHLLESLAPSSKLWSRSLIVRSVRGADYRPRLDLKPSTDVARRLERHLKRNFSTTMLPRVGIDLFLLVAWIAVWAYLAIIHPGPGVVSATVLFVSGLILYISLGWIELGFGLAVRDQRQRLYTLYWDLSEWLFDQFEEMNLDSSPKVGYRRKEHFRDNPWFSSSGESYPKKNGGGLT